MFARMHIAYRSFVDVNVCTHVSHVAVFHAHALEVTEWICAAHAASILRNCRWKCHADGHEHHLLEEWYHAEVRHAMLIDGFTDRPPVFNTLQFQSTFSVSFCGADLPRDAS